MYLLIYIYTFFQDITVHDHENETRAEDILRPCLVGGGEKILWKQLHVFGCNSGGNWAQGTGRWWDPRLLVCAIVDFGWKFFCQTRANVCM